VAQDDALRADGVFFALAVLALVLVARRRGRLDVFDLPALALTLATALEAIRGIVWFGLVGLAFLPALATRRSTPLEGRVATGALAAGLATIAAALLWSAVRPASSYQARFPHGLLDAVRAHAVHGRVLASDETSDWLLWELPSLRGRLGHDVRLELDTRAQIRRLAAWRTLAPGWTAATRGYALVVDDPQHVARLTATGRWRRVYSAATVAVAERRRASPT